MSRTIILLALAQAATVICGFFGLAIVLRNHGYPHEPGYYISLLQHIHWNPLSLFLRRFGMILLLVPLGWAVFAVNAESRAKFILPFSWWLIIGTIIPLALIMMFFYAIFHPYTTVH
jgi:hypothetical protein